MHQQSLKSSTLRISTNGTSRLYYENIAARRNTMKSFRPIGISLLVGNFIVLANLSLIEHFKLGIYNYCVHLAIFFVIPLLFRWLTKRRTLNRNIILFLPTGLSVSFYFLYVIVSLP